MSVNSLLVEKFIGCWAEDTEQAKMGLGAPGLVIDLTQQLIDDGMSTEQVRKVCNVAAHLYFRLEPVKAGGQYV